MVPFRIHLMSYTVDEHPTTPRLVVRTTSPDHSISVKYPSNQGERGGYAMLHGLYQRTSLPSPQLARNPLLFGDNGRLLRRVYT